MADYMALKEQGVEADKELVNEYQLTLNPQSGQVVRALMVFW